MSEPRIVSAVLTAAHTLEPSMEGVAKEMEGAMKRAVEDCLANGIAITDDATIKAAIMLAVAKTRAKYGLPTAD